MQHHYQNNGVSIVMSLLLLRAKHFKGLSHIIMIIELVPARLYPKMSSPASYFIPLLWYMYKAIST